MEGGIVGGMGCSADGVLVVSMLIGSCAGLFELGLAGGRGVRFGSKRCEAAVLDYYIGMDCSWSKGQDGLVLAMGFESAMARVELRRQAAADKTYLVAIRSTWTSSCSETPRSVQSWTRSDVQMLETRPLAWKAWLGGTKSCVEPSS